MVVSVLSLHNFKLHEEKTIYIYTFFVFYIYLCFNISEVFGVLWAEAVFFSFSRYPGWCIPTFQRLPELVIILMSCLYDPWFWWLISRLDDKLLGLDDKLLGLDDKLLGLDDKLLGLDDKLLGLDDKLHGSGDELLSIGLNCLILWM